MRKEWGMTQDTHDGIPEWEHPEDGPDRKESDPNPDGQDTSDGSGEQVPADKYKHLQAAFTRATQENKALKSQLDQLTGKVDLLVQTAPKKMERVEEDPLAFLESKELEEQLLENPAVARTLIRKTADVVRRQVAELLDLRDLALEERFKRTDPRIEENAEAIAELRKDQRFAQLPDDTLLAILERSPVEPKDGDEDEPGTRFTPRGGLSGGRRPVPVKKPMTVKDHPLYQQIYAKREQVVI